MRTKRSFSSSCVLEDGDVKSQTSITGTSKSDKEASRVAASFHYRHIFLAILDHLNFGCIQVKKVFG